MRWALLGCLLAQGCAWRVAVRSQPAGARITLPDGRSAATPTEITVPWRPFQRQILQVEAVGYRPLEVELRRGRTQGELLLLLVPEHGASGTWEADEVP